MSNNPIEKDVYVIFSCSIAPNTGPKFSVQLGSNGQYDQKNLIKKRQWANSLMAQPDCRLCREPCSIRDFSNNQI